MKLQEVLKDSVDTPRAEKWHDGFAEIPRKDKILNYNWTM